MAICPKGSETGSGSTQSSAAKYMFSLSVVTATVPRSLTAPSVRLSHQATSVLLVVLTQLSAAGQSVLTAQARLVEVEQLPHVNAAAESSTRPPPAAVLENAPTHQSDNEESTTGLWARTGDPMRIAREKITTAFRDT